MSEYISDVVNQPSGMDWAVSFNRKSRAPLDRSSIFDNIEDAKKYAKGDTSDPDKRGLCTTSYIGQVLSVKETNGIGIYYILNDRSLQKLTTTKEVPSNDDLKKLEETLNQKIAELYQVIDKNNTTVGQTLDGINTYIEEITAYIEDLEGRADKAVQDLDKEIKENLGVTSINSLKGNITLTEGNGIHIYSRENDNIVIEAIGGTGSSYITVVPIDSETDLDNLTTPGWYYCNSDAVVSTFENCPVENAFFMEVGKHAATYQRIVTYVIGSPKVYFRNSYAGTFGIWHREYTTADKPDFQDLDGMVPSNKLPTASTSEIGVVDTKSQTFSGTKTLTANLKDNSTAVTQNYNDSSTKIATTEFVKNQLNSLVIDDGSIDT